jgi:hypothetical protein
VQEIEPFSLVEVKCKYQAVTIWNLKKWERFNGWFKRFAQLTISPNVNAINVHQHETWGVKRLYSESPSQYLLNVDIRLGSKKDGLRQCQKHIFWGCQWGYYNWKVFWILAAALPQLRHQLWGSDALHPMTATGTGFSESHNVISAADSVDSGQVHRTGNSSWVPNSKSYCRCRRLPLVEPVVVNLLLLSHGRVAHIFYY